MRELHDDTLVLGYISVDFWEDWGEYYADVNEEDFRQLIFEVARCMMRKNLDGWNREDVSSIDEVLTPHLVAR